MVYWTSLDKEEVLDFLEEKDDILYLLGKMKIYWTPLGKNKRYLVSLKKRMIKWWYIGPLNEKQEKLGLLGERDDILYLLEKMIISWTPWWETRDTWSPWWKNDILNPLGKPENIWHRWCKEGSIEPPFEELFLISVLSFIIFDQYFWKIFLYLFFIVLVFILTIFKSKSKKI